MLAVSIRFPFLNNFLMYDRYVIVCNIAVMHNLKFFYVAVYRLQEMKNVHHFFARKP